MWDDISWAGGKQCANFPSMDCCSFNMSLVVLLWLFSSAFTSACIFLMPGVTIAPGLLFDADVEMLESVMK